MRLATLFILYVAQGVPIGLFWFAIPAWMAVNGADAGDIGYVVGLTALPWSLKLVNGFIMDRYTFLPMGRRRVWIMGAQCVMIALLVGCALVRPQVDDITLLALAGFIVNMATTFQDVGVDGLAVDIMEEDERARASGMMFGGQAIGIAASTSLTGIAIARLGPAAAYLIAAGFIALITTYLMFIRERPGERRLPWSAGEAHARNRQVHVGAWWPILTNTLRAMLKPVSLLWLPVMVAGGFHYGISTSITPLIGARELGWDEATISSVSGTAQFASGILGLTLGGWAGDRFGAKRSLIAVIGANLVLSTMMWLLHQHWGIEALYIGYVYAWSAISVLLSIAAIPMAMRLCDPRVAATQFTLYMATSNIGISLGALVFGLSADLSGLRPMFLLVFAFYALALVLMLVVKYPRKGTIAPEVLEEVAEAPGPAPIVS